MPWPILTTSRIWSNMLCKFSNWSCLDTTIIETHYSAVHIIKAVRVKMVQAQYILYIRHEIKSCKLNAIMNHSSEQGFSFIAYKLYIIPKQKGIILLHQGTPYPASSVDRYCCIWYWLPHNNWLKNLVLVARLKKNYCTIYMLLSPQHKGFCFISAR